MSVYVLLDTGHPARVAECQLTLCEVLDHPRNTLHGTLQIHAARDTEQQLPQEINEGLPVSFHLLIKFSIYFE